MGNVNATPTCSGGLLLKWNPDFMKVTRSFQGSRWLIVLGKLFPLDFDRAIRMINGGHSNDEQATTYYEIDEARLPFSCPFMLFGDFNQFITTNERKELTYDSIVMRNFREWISNSSLIDIPLVGRKYTLGREETLEVKLIDVCMTLLEFITFLEMCRQCHI